MKPYRIAVSSPPDRGKLVAEIFFGGAQWAEVHQERDVPVVEFYPRPDGEPWSIEWHAAVAALNEAKNRLMGL